MPLTTTRVAPADSDIESAPTNEGQVNAPGAVQKLDQPSRYAPTFSTYFLLTLRVSQPVSYINRMLPGTAAATDVEDSLTAPGHHAQRQDDRQPDINKIEMLTDRTRCEDSNPTNGQ